MRERVVRRALVVAVALAVAAAAVASADTLNADGDLVAPGFQSAIDLGVVGPGETVTFDMPFVLTCQGTSHVNPGQAVTISPTILSTMGGTVSATPTTIGPPPAGWPLDGDGCPSGIEPIVSDPPSVVTIVAPLADGEDYLIQVGYTRTYDPQSTSDGTAISNGMFTFASFTLDVVSNTAPTLILPTSVTQEGDVTGGAIAAYAFGATDAEDSPDPPATCSPAPGDVVPLGTTSVSCSVTDSGGLTTTGGFELTVVDTTAPLLAGLPLRLDLVASDAGGALLAYDLPTATDVVDPDPTVACAPAPGAIVPVGDSAVTCTAADDSGNVATATFPVHVASVSAAWESPIGGDPAFLAGNFGRTVPVKVDLFVGGVEKSSGTVDLVAAPCGGATVWSAPMTWQPDVSRWAGHLDTSALPGPGCYTVMASPDGGSGPSFRLELRDATQESALGRAKRP